MAAEYRLDIFSPGGVKHAQVVAMLSLAYTRRVNAPGVLTFTLPPEHPAIASLSLDSQVEVWRRDLANGVPWYRDMQALYRSPSYQVNDTQDEIFGATCVGNLHRLSRRIVAYPAGTAGKSAIDNTPAETIMHAIVEQNCAGLATVANGRIRTPISLGITVAADQGRGTVVSWAGAWKPVLTELQDLAKIGGGDFDLVPIGPAAWEWHFYPGQLGVDRTSGNARVRFTREDGNMGAPQLIRDRVEEKTVAIVAGQGQESGRQVVVRVGPDAGQNDIEVLVDARNNASTAALQAQGDRVLQEARSRQVLTYTVIQTPASLYGKHYFLGDLVQAQYRDVTATQKVMAATITLTSDGDEQVAIELQSWPL